MQESIDFLQKALDYYLLLDRKEDAAGTQMNIGQTYFNYQKIPEAKARLQAAYRYFEQYPSTEYGPTTFHLLGLIALREQKTAEAEQLLQKGVNQARTVGQLETILPLLNDLAQTQFALGKHAAAYLNLHDAMTLRDSINEARRIATLEEMQARFDLSQKDNELKINQLELRQRTQQRNGTLLAACLLALLAFLIYYGLRRRLRTNQQLAAQAAEIQRQTLRQLEQDHQLSVLQAMMDGQEQERTRIANDLHDGLGGLLAAVKSHVGALAPGPDTALREKTAQLIDEACGEVRRIAHNMLPRALAHAGLGGALEDLARDLEKQGLHCDLEIQGLHQAELTAAQNVQIYRIVQELSNNALKHARARRLLLQILAHQDVLTLLVEDDGQGFDPESPAGGIGLASVRSRVAFLQGSVEWDSVPGEGTTVVVQIPLPKKKL
jgi:signal transduction histidine kinase